MTNGRRGLTAALDPRSVAIVGASSDPDRVGGRPIAYLQRYGYQGAIWPVNPSRTEIQGLPSYPSLAALPALPEAVMVIVPGEAAVRAVEESAEAGVAVAVVIAAGFGETGPAGQALETRMGDAARANGMRLIGPNTQGLANFATGAILSFSTVFRDPSPLNHPIAVVSQSGSMAVVPALLLARMGLGIRHAHATGNEADVTAPELAAAVAADPAVRLVLLYVESIRQADALVELADVARRRDVTVVALKAGRSAAGEQAAQSHTGALANEDRVVDAFLDRIGIWRVHDSRELVAAAEMHLHEVRPPGARTVVLSQSGASCVQAADAAANPDLPLAELTPASTAALVEILPGYATTSNPIDLTGALLNDSSLFSKVLPVLAADPGVDAVVVALPVIGVGYDIETLAADSAAFSSTGKVLVAGITNPTSAEAFRRAGVIVYNTEVQAVEALSQAVHARARAARGRTGPVLGLLHPANASAAEDEATSLHTLAAYGVPVVAHHLCADADAAVAALHAIGGPVVLKGCSSRVAHKSDLGLVILGLNSETEVTAAFTTIAERLTQADPKAPGVLVAPLVPGRHEVMIGGRRDPIFGPMVLVGDGGTQVEALDDVAVLAPPFAREDVRQALGRLRVAPALFGRRAATPLDVEAVIDTVMCVADAMTTDHDTIVEIDINPLIVHQAGAGCVAVDSIVRRATATR